MKRITLAQAKGRELGETADLCRLPHLLRIDDSHPWESTKADWQVYLGKVYPDRTGEEIEALSYAFMFADSPATYEEKRSAAEKLSVRPYIVEAIERLITPPVLGEWDGTVFVEAPAALTENGLIVPAHFYGRFSQSKGLGVLSLVESAFRDAQTIGVPVIMTAQELAELRRELSEIRRDAELLFRGRPDLPDWDYIENALSRKTLVSGTLNQEEAALYYPPEGLAVTFDLAGRFDLPEKVARRAGRLYHLLREGKEKKSIETVEDYIITGDRLVVWDGGSERALLVLPVLRIEDDRRNELVFYPLEGAATLLDFAKTNGYSLEFEKRLIGRELLKEAQKCEPAAIIVEEEREQGRRLGEEEPALDR